MIISISVAAQQHIDELGHVGDGHKGVAIHVSTDRAASIIAAQQHIDKFSHIGDGHKTVVVHITSLKAVNEEGDADYRLITGITPDKFYTVKNLTAGGTFFFRVKAHYTDDTWSPWSKAKTVVLHGNQTWIKGDVNGDGEVDVRDITALIDVIMNSVTDNPRADVNEDADIDVRDITALIDIIMNN